MSKRPRKKQIPALQRAKPLQEQRRFVLDKQDEQRTRNVNVDLKVNIDIKAHLVLGALTVLLLTIFA